MYLDKFPDDEETVRAVFDWQHQSALATTARNLSSAREFIAEPPSVMPEYIGRYRIDRRLEYGEFGVVYLGRDVQLDRAVVIKVPHQHLMAHTTRTEEFLVEARTLAALDHPHIVPVLDVGSTLK